MRTEIDALGPVSLPENAYWGAQTARALNNFSISGKKSDPALIGAFLKIKSAAAQANQACGVLSPEKSRLIFQAAEKLLQLTESERAEYFPADIYQAGAGTVLNMNVNEVIANVANIDEGHPPGTYFPIHPNDDVNRSQSTNDTFPTAMRLALLELSLPLVEALKKLGRGFQQKGQEWESIPKAARTHLQDAVPMRLGDEFIAYGTTILRCAEWISDTRNDLRDLGIGGSAAGTGLNVPENYPREIIPALQALTGETLRSASNLYEAMQSQASIARYSAMLKISALELTRICNDLRLLASGPTTGFGELTLPAVQPGSSIMPGKVNPSIVEMCNQAWFSVLGADQTVSFALQAGQLELNVMMPIMAETLLGITRIATHSCTTLLDRCIEGIQPNRERLNRYFESTPQTATALTPKLGYQVTAALVQESEKEGVSILELVRRKKLLPDEELNLLLSPGRLTGRRGGRAA